MLQVINRPLIVQAHPDDEFLKAHVMHSLMDAHVLIATDGEASTIDLHGNRFVQERNRRHGSIRALGSLGIYHDEADEDNNRVHFRALPDNGLDRYTAELSGFITRIVRQYDLRSILSVDQDGFDQHPDHIAAFKSASFMARILGIPHVVRTKEPGEHTFAVFGDPVIKAGVLEAHASQWDASDPATLAHMKLYEGSEDFTTEYYRIAA